MAGIAAAARGRWARPASSAAAIAAAGLLAAADPGPLGVVRLPPWEGRWDERRGYVSERQAFEDLEFAPGNASCWAGRRRLECFDGVAPPPPGALPGRRRLREECEGRNALGDGFVYAYNEGRERGVGICGAGCVCCRRPESPLGLPALSFEGCCNTSAYGRGGNAACWARGLSFAECCSAEALRPSPLSRARRVVMGITTTPYRIAHLRSPLLSAVRQTHRPDAVYLLLPRAFLRDWAWYEVPWWYEFLDPEIVHIVRCEQDYRPSTSPLCVLQYEPDPDTYIVVVDDDVVYHPMLVEWLLERSAAHPGAMIGVYSLGREGAACAVPSPGGGCRVSAVSHGTYGKLFQRRFFDAGILNLAAAADALARIDGRDRFDYTTTACTQASNFWVEAHLALKGVPRVFFKRVLGARIVVETGYSRSALSTGYSQGFYEHHGGDPRSLDLAQDHCLRALESLWGTSLWSVQPRRVAAAALPRGAGASAAAEQLGRPWHDAAVLFACSGSSLREWREALLAHGGLRDRFTYMHRYAPGRRAPFLSELVDPAAFSPPPLRDSGGLRLAAAVPGREAAGTARPLAELVELCAPDLVAKQPSPEGPRGRFGAGCPRALVARDYCSPAPVFEELSPMGVAGVVCCSSDNCLTGSVMRNDSENLGHCFPSMARLHDAQRICQAVGLRLCDPGVIRRCCQTGCAMLHQVALWLRSPEAELCANRQAAALRYGDVDEAVQPAAEGDAPGPQELKRRQEAFLAYSEEARSTIVEWVTGREH